MVRKIWLTFVGTPVNGQWVIIAENRAGRPNDFEQADTYADIVKSKRVDCPFCYGNEAKTPKEIAAYQACEKDGRWLTRVCSNKYPAVHENVWSESSDERRSVSKRRFSWAS